MLINKLRPIVVFMGMALFISINAFGQNENQKLFTEKVISLVQENYMNPFGFNLDNLYQKLRQTQGECEKCTQGQLENKLSKVIAEVNDLHFSLTPNEWNEYDNFGPVGNLRFYGGKYGFYLVTVDNNLVVSFVHAKTPAGDTELARGDIILSVNGEKGSALHLEKIIRQSEVFYRRIKLNVLSVDGKEKNLEMIAGSSDGAFTARILQPNIALFTITNFDSGVADKWFHKALTDLKSKGIKKLILDVRYSNGGEPFAVVNMVGALVAKTGHKYLDKKGVKIKYCYEGGMTFYEKDDAGTITKETEAFPDAAFFDGDVAVLISSYSVSGPEVFSGMLQDTKRATLLGEPTFGGGGVLANLFTLIGDVQMVITTHRIFDLNGVPMPLITKPDVLLPLDGKLLKLGRDNQIERAVEILNSK